MYKYYSNSDGCIESRLNLINCDIIEFVEEIYKNNKLRNAILSSIRIGNGIGFDNSYITIERLVELMNNFKIKLL